MFTFGLLIFTAFLVFTISIPSLAVLFILIYFLISSYILFVFNLPFLSVIVLIVYVGAVAILFVFCTMLFERNAPVSGYFSFRKFSIYLTFSIFTIGFFKYFSPIFKSLNTEQILTGLKYTANRDVLVSDFQTLSTFLDVFSSFFFTTDLGLLYTTAIGFLLFFFTIIVTYIFYFTKKLGLLYKNGKRSV